MEHGPYTTALATECAVDWSSFCSFKIVILLLLFFELEINTVAEAKGSLSLIFWTQSWETGICLPYLQITEEHS